MTSDLGSEYARITGSVAPLRLLPWLGPEAKPCYLSADDIGGRISRLADETEELQLAAADRLVSYAVDVLADQNTSPQALVLLGCRLADALRDVTRVAVSRGMRLPAPGHPDVPEEDEAPPLP